MTKYLKYTVVMVFVSSILTLQLKLYNMKVKYVSGKWIVMTNHSQQIIFCHDSKSKCYEWIFKRVNYA